MHPADAVRQLEYAVAPTTGSYDYEITHWADAYEDVFADVTERGDLYDVMSVIEQVSKDCSEDSRPSPEQVKVVADSVLTDGGRPLTDGGDEMESSD
ncbi:hypothetical protein SAMN04488063_1751 [Halopelagius inordinatus]|uniref:Uncharacterized protein n=1 Tax=Halopelagius inordinatus TaxID=553467 RepID=A0A1I2R3D3_9EURY|nr:hypothetical protein [Halopelagius inordinatus]SFG34533.1 hypothetical protein SAMN04488063_1751 [Halopelagius inordinatus]